MSKAEKFISDCTRNCSNELCSYESRCGNEVVSYHEWLTPDQALRAVEIARKEIYDWLDDNLALYNACNSFVEKSRLFKDLKKAMKDG